MRFELHPEARAEFRAAAIWYDEREPGLGDAFIAEINSRVSDVIRGRIERFTIDALVEMLARAGVRLDIVARAV